MTKAIEITTTYYQCPYCGTQACNKGDIESHIPCCNRNPELHKRDCWNCKYGVKVEYRRKIGHSIGYRPEIWDTMWCCKLHYFNNELYCCKFEEK